MKMHNMQDKIFDAAMLSVKRKPLPGTGPPEASFLQNVDRKFFFHNNISHHLQVDYT